MKLVTCYYLEKSGRKPAEDFINDLDYKTQRKFFAKKALLEEFGHMLPEPHAKYIGDSIFELRFKGAEGAIRVLYFFFHKNAAIFTNGFIKKSNKTPKQKIAIAINSRKAFLKAHGEGGD